MKEYAFGVDIGGTTIKMGLFSTKGKLLEMWEIPTRTENNGASILADIATEVKEKMKEKQITVDDVEGLGMGVPGADQSGWNRIKVCKSRMGNL